MSEIEITAHDFVKIHEKFIYDLEPSLGPFWTGSSKYLKKGWSSPETSPQGETYLWSIGKQSEIRFFYVPQQGDLNVMLTCEPLPVKDEQQSIGILINNQKLTTILLDQGVETYTFIIPQKHLRFGENALVFTYSYAKSPKTLNMGEDIREIGVRFLRIHWGGASPEESGIQRSARHLVNISRIKINDDMKVGIMQLPQSAFWTDKRYIPPNALLRFSLGIHPEVQSLDTEVTFSVRVKVFTPYPWKPSVEKNIFSETLNLSNPGDRIWKDYTVDLAEFSGKVLSFWLSVVSKADPGTVVSMWGEPKISAKVNNPQYNVVLITMDALRQDHVSAYGYNRKTTPNVDAFGKDAIKFSNCYANAPATPTSFASFYTSLNPQSHGVKMPNFQLHPKFPTPPSFLKPYGYFTQLITSHPYFDMKFGLPKDFNNRDPDILNISKPLFIEGIQKWLNQHKEDRFFLHIHIIPPHTPYYAVAPYDEAFLDFRSPALQGTLKLFFSIQVDPFIQGETENAWRRNITDGQKRSYIMDLYDAGLASADEFFGRILKELKAQGLYDEAFIIFASDHGEQFWEHGELGHGSCIYDEVMRIPFLVKFPKSINISSQDVDFPISTIDWLPTVLAVNGIPAPEYFEGESFFDPNTKELQAIKREYTFLGQNAADKSMGQRGYEGVLWKGYKYIYSTVVGTEELYYLPEDACEEVNLVSERPEIREQLRTVQKKYNENVTRRKIFKEHVMEEERASPEKRNETLRRLEELGYVH